MPRNPILAKHRVESARAHRKAVYERMVEEEAENRRAYERFYNSLALFSGGTVALSVSYLGYLSSGPRPVLDKWVLVLSWVCLLLAMISSIFANLFHTHYAHYARVREYAEKSKSEREIEAEEIPGLPVVGFTSRQEYDSYRETLMKAAQKFDTDAQWARRREQLYSFFYVWDSRAAQALFVLGLSLLCIFAVRNI